MQSIIQKTSRFCYIHEKYLGVEVPAVHIHHCIHGTANRSIADKEQLCVALCARCHRMLHDKGYHDLDLQQDAEMAWLKYNNKSIDDWIKIFGKNYLDERKTPSFSYGDISDKSQ